MPALWQLIATGSFCRKSISPHFSSADRAMRKALEGSDVADLGVGPRFRILAQGLQVSSRDLSFSHAGVSLRFVGVVDALVATEHYEYVELDYKTTTQPDHMLREFRRQLASYAFALERPNDDRNDNYPAYVDGMALLVFDPERFVFKKAAKVAGLYGRHRWLKLPRRDDLFDQS